MKHKIYLLLFLALSTLTTSTFASTNVPASISTDTQWDASGSPYLIQGKVVVAKGATLHISPGVQVVFQGPSAMEVNGTLDVEGSAAAPAVFRMTEGGLQSELFINGGTADITNARVLSGVFLVQDSQLHLQWFEITKGSGLYLRGATTASVENGKIYGNATGVVLDGQVKATLEFNTITENTYGLYLKSFTGLDCTNNSIHDNDKEVINSTSAAMLGNNYWGNSDEKTVQAKIQGPVSLAPLKTLKDVLRIYIRTQLPVITKQMETALKTQERKEKQQTLALQKAQKQPAATAPAPAAEASAPAAAPEATEAAPEAVEAAEPESPAGTTVAKVKELPAVPHTLKPLANLPPDQGDVSEEAAVVPSASAESQATSPVNPSVATEPSSTAPAVSEPPPAVSATAPPVPPSPDNSAAPSLPTSDAALQPPPAVGDTSAPAPSSTSASTVPVPPEVSGSASSSASAPVPPAGDVIAPPASSVPAPPDLNEQMPPAPEASSTVDTTAANPPAAPPPPVPAGSTDNNVIAPPPPAPAQPAAAAPPPAPAVNPEDQKKAVQSLDGVSGDIDGMQAPPLDLGPDLSSPATSNGSTSSPATATAPTSNSSSDSSLALPPLKDADVQPPKDLDLPPTDDLGNINIDSKSK